MLGCCLPCFVRFCFTVKSEEDLFEVYNKTRQAGLPHCLICDNGLTEFHGVPTYTCLAIGPAKEEEIDKITGGLKLI